jgi:hypothetical protein
MAIAARQASEAAMGREATDEPSTVNLSSPKPGQREEQKGCGCREPHEGSVAEVSLEWGLRADCEPSGGYEETRAHGELRYSVRMQPNQDADHRQRSKRRSG